MLTQVKKKPDPREVTRAVTAREPASTGPDPLETKGSDPLAKLSKDLDGPSSLADDVLGAHGSGAIEAALKTDGAATGPPEVGGGGTDPLRWVLGTQAPSIADVRDLARSAISDALELHKSAPRTDENKAFLDAARRLDNEVGQFGALTSLAKMSGNWQWCGIHATGQLFEALAVVAEMAEALVTDRGNPIGARAREYTDKVRAGRQNFYGRSAPYAQEGGLVG